MLHENPLKLPAGIIEEARPDEESRYGRDLGTSAKVTWSWLKSKFGKMPPDPSDYPVDKRFDGKWGRLYIEVRPFDANGQWLDNLQQEFTSSGLKDAQRYGFELMRDMPEVQGFWLEGKLDKYWTNEGLFGTKNVMTLGRYERAPLSPKDQALADANARGHQMSQWSGPLRDRAACTKCGDEMHWVESTFAGGRGHADGRAAYNRKCSGDASRYAPNGQRARLAVTSAQMSIVQIHCDDPAHDDEREDWWPTQVSTTIIEFPADRAEDVARLLTDISNSESDDPGGDPGAWRAATALASKVRRQYPSHTPNARRPDNTYLVLDLGDGLAATRLKAERNKTLGGAMLETWKVHPIDEPYAPVAQIQIFQNKDFSWSSWSVMPRYRVYGNALAAARNATRLTPNAPSVHYVWLLDYRNVPLESEGPYGPMSLSRAEAFARIGAKNGDHDRVVSFGASPTGSDFEIVRRYRRGTGERVL